MSYFARMTRSGVPVVMPAETAPSWVQFGSDPVIPLPPAAWPGLDLVAADVDSTQIAVLIGSDDYGYYVQRNPARVRRCTPGKVHGQYSIQIEPDGVISWVPADNPYVVRYSDSQPETPSRDTQHPRSPDPLSRFAVAPGIVVTQVVRSGRWMLGEWIGAPDGVTVLYAHDGERGYEVWRGYAPLPSFLIEHADGTATVAVTTPRGVDAPLFIPSSAFTPIVEAPAVVQSFPSTTMPIAVGVMDEPGLGHAILVGPSDWSNPRAVGRFCTANRDDMSRVRPLPSNLPLYVYWDDPEYVHAAEGDEIGAAQAYPRPNESREAFRARLHRAVDAGARCFVFATYRQWNGSTYALSEQAVLDSHRDVWDVAVSRGVLVLWGFNWQRGNPAVNGAVYWPSFRESVRRMREASSDWHAFPTVHIQAPPPEIEESPMQKYYAKSYSEFMNDALYGRQRFGFAIEDGYGAGLVAYRLLIELRPLDQIQAPDWTPPHPITVPYVVVADVLVPALIGIRQRAGLGTAFSDIATDLFRLFGPEDWSRGKLLADLTHGDASQIAGGLATLFR